MFVDASALTAMLTNESDARDLITRLQRHPRRITSPLALWETVIAVTRILGLTAIDAQSAVEQFLDLMGIEIIPVPVEAGALAINAWARYGKSRHPAALNFGDCFAYAGARAESLPLLFKGDDFSRTDVQPA
jgi:ribonuclease VapC